MTAPCPPRAERRRIAAGLDSAALRRRRHGAGPGMGIEARLADEVPPR
jgi:hypothetical protein